jgi:hypothetical protein
MDFVPNSTEAFEPYASSATLTGYETVNNTLNIETICSIGDFTFLNARSRFDRFRPGCGPDWKRLMRIILPRAQDPAG